MELYINLAMPSMKRTSGKQVSVDVYLFTFFRGGYILRPESFEFWQGQTNRLHDRFLFRKPQAGEQIDKELTHEGDHGWVFERLSS